MFHPSALVFRQRTSYPHRKNQHGHRVAVSLELSAVPSLAVVSLALLLALSVELLVEWCGGLSTAGGSRHENIARSLVSHGCSDAGVRDASYSHRIHNVRQLNFVHRKGDSWNNH